MGKTAFTSASWPTGQPSSSTTNTTTTENTTTTQQSMKKIRIRWKKTQARKRERKRCGKCNEREFEGEKRLIRKSNRKRDRGEIDREEVYVLYKNTEGLGLNCASQAWLSLTLLAPHEIIFILYKSKGSPVENERLHRPKPKPS